MREHEKHEHIDDEHDHNDRAEDMTWRERPLDLAAVRAKLPNNTSFHMSSNRTSWSLASRSFMRPRCRLARMPSAFWSKAMKGGPRKSKAIQTIHRASALRTHLPRLRS